MAASIRDSRLSISASAPLSCLSNGLSSAALAGVALASRSASACGTARRRSSSMVTTSPNRAQRDRRARQGPRGHDAGVEILAGSNLSEAEPIGARALAMLDSAAKEREERLVAGL